MARLRPVGMTKALKNLSEEVYLSHDDPFIDFSSAGLYLVGLQTTVATVACAGTSIACCWLMPINMISAVRTLAMTSLVAFACMRKPIRVGRVRGVTTIFNALRPCVVLYVAALTIEQLVHTCVPTDHRPNGYTRRVVFHCTIALMAAAGLWRAAKPLLDTDAPFLVTALCVVVLAVLPPPAAPLTGPLCEGTSLFGAGERLMRAFLFAALYVIHVYCSPPVRNSIHDLAVCIMRSGAAAVWVLGCHLFVVWVALIQAIVALWARFGSEPPSGVSTYNPVDTRSDSGLSDAELGTLPSDYRLDRDSNGVLVAPYMRDPPASYAGRMNGGMTHVVEPLPQPLSASPMADRGLPEPVAGHLVDPARMNGLGHGGMHMGLQVPASPSPTVLGDSGVPVDPRQLASLVGQGGNPMSKDRMAAIAAQM